MFKKILVANRGEIAVRIIQACKELGIISVAIYSEADKNALHVRLADEAYFVGNSVPSESYLNINKIIEICKKCGAEAIHPGYGFLSERFQFIKAVEDNGLVLIGPSSLSVSKLGGKTSARRLMIEHNIPIVPGNSLAIANIAEAVTVADTIGYPVIIKAVAGGGGKGMKKVFAESELEDAINSARREAMKSFGNDEVYIEKLILKPKHIEVQILGDKFGNYIHLFERECSAQRRHQKVIEEAPSISINEKLRQSITSTAINVAKAANYYNAGTVEFLLDSNENFFFLEMNTRIQVEHPVTELISGVDLIQQQIKIAFGERLSIKQEDLKIRSHAIECRLYAEDPENDFLPTTGKIGYYSPPSGAGIRLDSGIAVNSTVGLFYDPMLAKLITYADSRDNAISKMIYALQNFHISGLKTNIPFLIKLLNDPEFQSGKYDINLIDSKYSGNIKKEYDNNSLQNVLPALAVICKLVNAKKTITKANSNRDINRSLNNQWLQKSYE